MKTNTNALELLREALDLLNRRGGSIHECNEFVRRAKKFLAHADDQNRRLPMSGITVADAKRLYS